MPNIEIDKFKSATVGSGLDEDGDIDMSDGTSYIITIGIDTYKNADLKLNSCVSDCNALTKTLTDQYSFKAFDEPLINEKATRTGILDLIKKFRKSSPSTNDSLLLFFSGHGHIFPIKKDEQGQITEGIGCWVPYECTQSDELDDLLKLSDVIDQIRQINIRHIVLVSDCCNSGGILETPFFYKSSSKINPGINARHLPSRWAICSSRSNQLSAAGNTGQLSRFTDRLVHELKTNLKDELTIFSLLANLLEHFTKQNWQTPYGEPLDILDNNAGLFVFEKKKDILTICNREKILSQGLMTLNYKLPKEKIEEIKNSKNNIEAKGSKCVTFISGTQHCGLTFLGYFVKRAIFRKDTSVNLVSPADLYAEGNNQILQIFNSALRTNAIDAETLKKILIAKLAINDVAIEIRFNSSNALLEKMKIDLINNILEFLSDINAAERKLNKLVLVVVDEERVDFSKSKWKQFDSSITSFIIPEPTPIQPGELSTWYTNMRDFYAGTDDQKLVDFENLFDDCLYKQINLILKETDGYPGKVIKAICENSGCYELSDKYLNR